MTASDAGAGTRSDRCEATASEAWTGAGTRSDHCESDGKTVGGWVPLATGHDEEDHRRSQGCGSSEPGVLIDLEE